MPLAEGWCTFPLLLSLVPHRQGEASATESELAQDATNSDINAPAFLLPNATCEPVLGRNEGRRGLPDHSGGIPYENDKNRP
jgi:hypothetical protein